MTMKEQVKENLKNDRINSLESALRVMAEEIKWD